MTFSLSDERCIVLIGMAAAGKTTVGRRLAEVLDWGHVDTDYLIEAAYGASLQSVTDSLTKDEFLDVEASTMQSLQVKRMVISTGGSVVYREAGMRRLAALGPLVHLDVPLPVILERIARKPDRGLAIGPGQTVEDLFAEREALYKHWATYVVHPAGTVEETVESIVKLFDK